MKVYRNIIIIVLITASFICLIPRDSKAYGLVEYLGDSEKFIFSPGSDISKKELFVEHESMMPGDEIEDVIEIRNKASENVNIQAYVRAIDIDESKENFLSYVTMHIKQNKEKVLHSSKATEANNLQDWVYLGDVKSGSKMSATLELDISKNLDNRYSLSSGELKWQFKVVEVPAQETAVNNNDNTSQNTLFGKGLLQTGDNNYFAITIVLICAVSLFGYLMFGVKKKGSKRDEEDK